MHPRPRETKLAVKKNRILNEVFREGGCLRFDLARRLNINASMAGAYVEELLRDGLLVEGDPAAAPRGRAPLHPNPHHGCFLGLDFEALRARAVLCDFAGEVLYRKEAPFRSGVTREGVLKQIVTLARRVADRADRTLLSVGVAAPGQVDCDGGRVLHYRLLPDFDQVPIRDRFANAFAAPVFVEDNIRAVAYGELLRGSGRGARNFVCLAVRSGVGLGIVIDGKLYSGTNSMAGEAGYLVLSTAEGPRLATELVSAKGIVESTLRLLKSRASTAVRRELLERGDDLSLADIVAAADSGDDLLRQQMEQLGTHLGMLAANLANLLAPEKIVLTGEVPNCSPLVRQQMERTFRQFALPPILATAYLEDGVLGGFAGALGAAWLGFARTFPVDEEVLVRQARERRQPVQVGS
ncbi:MAG: ROK family transcriptional regulator [Pirellulaceae bacterium]